MLDVFICTRQYGLLNFSSMAFKEIFACSRGLNSVNESTAGAESKKENNETSGILSQVREKTGYLLDYPARLAERDFERNLEALKAFKFYDADFFCGLGVKHPSLGEVKELMRKELTPAQADCIRMMRRPVFELAPVTTYDRYTDVYTNFLSLAETEWVRKAWDNYDGNKKRNNWAPITGWEAAVCEDADFSVEGDCPDATLRERMEWFEKEFGAKGIKGMDFRRYMMSAMLRMAPGAEKILGVGRGVDCNTLLNGAPVYDGCAAVGSLNAEDGFMHIRDVDPQRRLNNVVLRPSVVFPVLRG